MMSDIEKCNRVNVTFWFDEDSVSESDLHDRLEALLVEHFPDVRDWHTRWTTRLEDSPLFGANRLGTDSAKTTGQVSPPKAASPTRTPRPETYDEITAKLLADCGDAPVPSRDAWRPPAPDGPRDQTGLDMLDELDRRMAERRADHPWLDELVAYALTAGDHCGFNTSRERTWEAQKSRDGAPDGGKITGAQTSGDYADRLAKISDYADQYRSSKRHPEYDRMGHSKTDMAQWISRKADIDVDWRTVFKHLTTLGKK